MHEFLVLEIFLHTCFSLTLHNLFFVTNLDILFHTCISIVCSIHQLQHCVTMNACLYWVLLEEGLWFYMVVVLSPIHLPLL